MSKISIGPKIKKIAKVNISSNTIEIGQSVGLYPDESPIRLQDLRLKPLSHFNFKSESNCYVLNINVLTGSHHKPDPKNALECKTIGRNILVFINYATEPKKKKTKDNYQNFRYRIEFSDKYTDFIKGKEIIIATASGDPEEGSVTKVIVEDEDEI